MHARDRVGARAHTHADPCPCAALHMCAHAGRGTCLLAGPCLCIGGCVRASVPPRVVCDERPPRVDSGPSPTVTHWAGRRAVGGLLETLDPRGGRASGQRRQVGGDWGPALERR